MEILLIDSGVGMHRIEVFNESGAVVFAADLNQDHRAYNISTPGGHTISMAGYNGEYPVIGTIEVPVAVKQEAA